MLKRIKYQTGITTTKKKRCLIGIIDNEDIDIEDTDIEVDEMSDRDYRH